jgi:hypothetical protein
MIPNTWRNGNPRRGRPTFPGGDSLHKRRNTSRSEKHRRREKRSTWAPGCEALGALTITRSRRWPPNAARRLLRAIAAHLTSDQVYSSPMARTAPAPNIPPIPRMCPRASPSSEAAVMAAGVGPAAPARATGVWGQEPIGAAPAPPGMAETPPAAIKAAQEAPQSGPRPRRAGFGRRSGRRDHGSRLHRARGRSLPPRMDAAPD